MKLPRFIALKSKHNGKYLRCTTTEEGSSSSAYGLLRFSGDYVVSPYTKFEVEPADIGKGLVHLKCRYNNKYWVRASVSERSPGGDSPDSFYIAAAAKLPEEDQSKELCTLFKPVYNNNNTDEGGIRFLHVQQGFYVFSQVTSTSDDEDEGYSFTNFEGAIDSFTGLLMTDMHLYIKFLALWGPGMFMVPLPWIKWPFRPCCPNHPNYSLLPEIITESSSLLSALKKRMGQVGSIDFLCAGTGGGGGGDAPNDSSSIFNAFEIVDWDSILILPRYVAFKNLDGKYLIPCDYWSHSLHKRLQFAGSDKREAAVVNEVFPAPDGKFRVKNISLNQFWRHGDDGRIWVCPDTGDTYNDCDPSVLFSAIKVENNKIAIRSEDNHKFCKIGRGGRLKANDTTISERAQIAMEELVFERDIYDVHYHMSDAKIRSGRPLTMATEFAVNNTPEPGSVEVKLRFVKSKSSTWKSTVSTHSGVKTKIMFKIPYFTDGGSVELSEDTTESEEWEETVSESKEVEGLYRAVVPPMSKVKVSALATLGSCDIPFSYTQRDKLYDGRVITSYMDDGIYRGIDHFNIQHKADPI